MEKIKLALGIIIGLVLTYSSGYISKIAPKKPQEEIVTVNCKDVYILDSTEFSHAADSVTLYGNEKSYTELLYHYGSITNGSMDFLYYSLIMANKYSYPEASYNVSWIIDDFIKNNTSLLSEMTKYYLLYGAKLGSLNSYFLLKEYYEKGILFEKNLRKAKIYEDKIKKAKEIKWIK